MDGAEDRFSQWQEISSRWQHLVQSQFQQKLNGQQVVQIPDPQSVEQAFKSLWLALLQNPAPALQAQANFWHDYTKLTQQAFAQFWLGAPAAPASTDKRFKDEAWASNQAFAFIQQAYLLLARHVQNSVSQVTGMDVHTAKQVNFYVRQLLGALSPSNFATTNPAVIKATLESGGENLLTGMRHLLEDLDRSQGRLMPRMTDFNAFKLGENIAATPGKVIFQNELIQLIQYNPTTETVHQHPLLVIPPWINKFYILDLKPKNSLIRWLVEQGHTVFVISWVNPGPQHRHKGFDDYMKEGPLAALDAIEAATGEKQVNVAAYCIGGTLLAATLAWMTDARDKQYPIARIRSATFFTTMIDFSEPGELGVFIDEPQLKSLEAYMDEKGYLEGHQMAGVFNMLRENDLIWSFVINNYLLGREPMAFDLLYWNCDSTRMPAAMHRFYLRKMYLENKLCQAGGIELAGIPIDIRHIKTPAYFISAREDHIAPWQSTFAGAKLFSGPVRFVLGGSGHIAGIVNPPSANKYGYATNNALADSPDEWFARSTQHEGSWWLDWAEWVKPYCGRPLPARQPGQGKLPAIEDAPGRYVKARLND